MLNIMQPVKQVILVLGSWGTKAPCPSSLRPMYAVLGLKRMAMTHTAEDRVAAMWKVQLLNGVAPTQFSGHPADFPFFRDQVRTHLESELLTDAQRVMYLPKFLTGEAIEVVNRNRGCSYEEILKTLEDRFGQAVQVTQAWIEELVGGPKFESGDNVSLLNFAEKLNTATKILKGEFDHEANVATNFKRIVNRLPDELIIKWQGVNYNIVQLGRSAKLQDIASFVKKQALMKNNPGIWNAVTKER